MASGQTLYVTTGGYYAVSSITNGTTVVLTNLGYTGNASPAATISSGATVSPAGIQGSIGGAISIGYTFSTTTTDADPGSGALRLSSGTQNTTTVIRADLLDTAATDWTTVLDTFDDSTNTVKGIIRIVKTSDASKWLTFNVTALASPTGYRNITVTNTGSSAASPFANNDAVTLTFDRAGDVGATGNGNTLSANSGSTDATSTSATFAAPTSGTAATVTVSVSAGQKLLVTLYTSCENTNSGKGCYMSFDASSTGSAGITQSASDSTATGTDTGVAGQPNGTGGAFLFTAAGTGTVTFTAKYRRISNTATFHTHSIFVQVFS
jgi:hypothetical protein